MKTISFFLFFSFQVLAQSPAEIAELAAKQTHQHVLNQEVLKMRNLEINQSSLWKNPELSIYVGRARTGRDSGSAFDFSLVQALPWPGSKEVLRDETKIMRDLTNLSNEEASLRVYHDSYLLSIELGYFEKINESNISRSKRLKEIRKYLNVKTVVSENDKIEKDLIENQMLLVDNYIFEIQSKLSNLRSRLKRLTKSDIKEIQLKLMPLNLMSKSNLRDLLMNSPTYKRSLKEILLAQNAVRKSELESRPEISVGINYQVEQLDPANEFVYAVAGVTLPIWDRGQYREEIARANLRKEETRSKFSEMELLNTFDEIYQRLELSFYQSKNFDVSKLPTIQKKVRQAETAFRKGRITASSLLQVDTLAQETVEITFKARFEFFKSLADIFDLLGQKMEI